MEGPGAWEELPWGATRETMKLLTEQVMAIVCLSHAGRPCSCDHWAGPVTPQTGCVA